MPTATKIRKPRKPAPPPTLTITFTINEDRYNVAPLATHPEVAKVAYRFHKLTGDLAVYDVHQDTAGHVECTCPGCTYHRKPCKHVKTLVAAGMLPRTVLEPAPVNNDNAVPEWPGRDMA
jgi:hypothetical protein